MINKERNGYWEEIWFPSEESSNVKFKTHSKGNLINGKSDGYWEFFSFETEELILKGYYV